MLVYTLARLYINLLLAQRTEEKKELLVVNKKNLRGKNKLVLPVAKTTNYGLK